MSSLESHAKAATGALGRVIITGASGFLGSALAEQLRRDGAAVQALRRGRAVRPPDITWAPDSGQIDAERLEGADAVINLAGEPLAQRWTAGRKQRIRESRVAGTSLLARTLAGLRRPPRVLASGSAIGIYGDQGDEELDETTPPGTGFLADVASAWEAAAEPARQAGIRVVLLRTGLVLSPLGGALAKMLIPFRSGLGGRVGSGRQWMSWIALTDWVRATIFALHASSLSGPVNLVAPNAVRNAAFAETLGAVLHRPTVAAVPSVAVDLLFGEMGRATLLGSQRVLPRALPGAGFRFAHPELEGALRAELLPRGKN